MLSAHRMIVSLNMERKKEFEEFDEYACALFHVESLAEIHCGFMSLQHLANERSSKAQFVGGLKWS